MEDRTYTVHQLVNDPSFVEWAMGSSEGKKAEYWNRWVQQSEENRKKALRAQKKITGVRFTSPQTPDIKQEWDKVRDDIIKNDQAKPATKGHKIKNRSGRFLSFFLKAAAVLLVGAFVGFAVYLYQESDTAEKEVAVETVKTEYEEKKTIKLSDGSTIILAAGSQISYKSNWLDNPVKRVNLHGEAYFSIAPQELKGKPKFVVETEDGSASVWGTRFTVDTYGEGTQVVLEEGEVHIQVANTADNKEAEVRMTPGEMATFRNAKTEIALDQVNPAVYTSWTTNELYFDETPFSVLVERIRRTYGKKVIVKDQEVLDMKLSGSIDFRSLGGLMDAVSEVMNVNIYQSNQTVIVESNQP